MVCLTVFPLREGRICLTVFPLREGRNDYDISSKYIINVLIAYEERNHTAVC
jgi:hypothetical protein